MKELYQHSYSYIRWVCADMDAPRNADRLLPALHGGPQARKAFLAAFASLCYRDRLVMGRLLDVVFGCGVCGGSGDHYDGTECRHCGGYGVCPDDARLLLKVFLRTVAPLRCDERIPV